LCERPANPFVGRFLGEANLIEGTVMDEAGEVVRLRLPAGQELAPRSNSSGTRRGMLFIRPERVDYQAFEYEAVGQLPRNRCCAPL
jgi:ABC-type Fe3+/spermidine/putrescine transport system ATPase subunit